MHLRLIPLILFNIITLSTLLFFVASPIGVVHARTIAVTTSDDNEVEDGFCSLREAIRSANTNQVLFAAAGECLAGEPDGIAEDVIMLAATKYMIQNQINSNFAFEATESLTIQGVRGRLGRPQTVIDGSLWQRALIALGSGQNYKFESLQIQNFGQAQFIPAFGVISQTGQGSLGQKIVIAACDFKNNIVPYGGIALHVLFQPDRPGHLIVKNSWFHKMTGQHVISIKNASAKINNSRFSQNSAALVSQNQDLSLIEKQSLTIDDSEFKKKYA